MREDHYFFYYWKTKIYLFTGGEHAGNEGETDYNKVVSLPPQEICFGNGDVPATNIVCGQHHTGIVQYL